MQLVDANVLLYATNRTARSHAACRAWLESALGGGEPLGFSWLVLLAFLRISTRAQVFDHPLSPEKALDTLDAWLGCPAATLVHPTQSHASVLRRLLVEVGTAGNLTSDAHLAALAIEHGATLVSCDTDFARFKGLRWMNPADAAAAVGP